jgi:hypothetical protein
MNHSFIHAGGMMTHDPPVVKFDSDGDMIRLTGFKDSSIYLTKSHAEHVAREILALLEDDAMQEMAADELSQERQLLDASDEIEQSNPDDFVKD